MTGHLDEDLTVALALDDLADGDRAAALEHLRGCGSCRMSYNATIVAVEAVLPATPHLEPGPGFDDRVLAAMGMAATMPTQADTAPVATHLRRRRAFGRRLPAVAAMLVGLGLGAGATVLATQGDASQVVVTGTPLTTRDGSVVGAVTRASAAGEPVLVVTVAGAPSGARYTCRVVLADDSTVDAGTWTLADGGGAWVLPGLDVDEVTAVEMIRADGVVWSTADLGSA